VAAAFLLELQKEKRLPQRIKDNSHHPGEQFTAKCNLVKKVSYLRDAEWEFCRVTTKSSAQHFCGRCWELEGRAAGTKRGPPRLGTLPA
jgi:hypothetical protein